jgi:7tm Odorant receptor
VNTKGYGICGGINITLIMMLCGQFDVLYASLKNLSQTVLSEEQTKIHQQNLNFAREECNQYLVSDEKLDQVNEEAGCDIHQALVECVKHHKMILDYARLLEDLFRWFMLPKLFYSG